MVDLLGLHPVVILFVFPKIGLEVEILLLVVLILRWCNTHLGDGLALGCVGLNHRLLGTDTLRTAQAFHCSCSPDSKDFEALKALQITLEWILGLNQLGKKGN